MGNIDFFLGPQGDHESRLSFGHETALAYEAGDEGYIDYARQMAIRAKYLLESRDELDRLAVNQINTNYFYQTFRPATDRLVGRLDRPLGYRPLDWLTTASIHDIAEFASVNRQLYYEYRAALKRDQPDLTKYVIDGVHQLVDGGYLPSDGAELYDKAFVHYANWKPIETFESGARRVAGYCTNDTLALSNQYINASDCTGLSRAFFRTAMHESSHGAARRGGRGFFIDHPSGNGNAYFSFICEALAEHTTSVHEAVSWGHPDLVESEIIDPYARRDGRFDFKIYATERKLVSMLGLSAVSLVETELSSRDTRRGRRLRNQVLFDLRENFASYEAIFEFVEKYNSSRLPSEKMQVLNQKIAEIEGTKIPIQPGLARK